MESSFDSVKKRIDENLAKVKKLPVLSDEAGKLLEQVGEDMKLLRRLAESAVRQVGTVSVMGDWSTVFSPVLFSDGKLQPPTGSIVLMPSPSRVEEGDSGGALLCMSWTKNRNALLDEHHTVVLTLKHPVSVFFSYWTAWANDYGVHFRPDVYHRDSK